MDKSEMRAQLRARRAVRAARQGAADRTDAASALLARALESALVPTGRAPGAGPVIASYLPTDSEPDPTGIGAYVRDRGGRVLLPVPLPGRVLEWVADSGRRAPDPRLPVPIPLGPSLGRGARVLLDQRVGLVLIPALAVDRSGTRLGQGGGFYDVLLAELHERMRAGEGEAPGVIAVVHDDEVLPAGTLPREPLDVPVSLALTPSGVHRLKPPVPD